jgi:predicted nucleic acid-binding protein
MSGLEFLDTDILIYGYDLSDVRKRQIAHVLIERGLTGDVVTSTQVLGEFAATLLHKSVPRFEPRVVIAILDTLNPIRLVAPDGEMIRRGIDVKEHYGLHFYDSLIVAAAERAGCDRIWSEDMNSGQQYFGITVQNPFETLNPE